MRIGNKKGFALLGWVGIILILVILTSIALSAMYDQYIVLTTRMKLTAENYSYAEFGINRAIWRIDLPDSNLTFDVNGNNNENGFAIPADTTATLDIKIHKNAFDDYTITSQAKTTSGDILRAITAQYKYGKIISWQ